MVGVVVVGEEVADFGALTGFGTGFEAAGGGERDVQGCTN
jgi:hypothetical protein